MGLIQWNSAFDVIEQHMSDPSLGGQARLTVVTADGAVRMAPQDLRDALTSRDGANPLAAAVWQEAIRAAQGDPTAQRTYRLLAVWLALPRVRKAVRLAAIRLHADRRELEAEILLGLIEGITSADPYQAGVDGQLIRGAVNRMWTAVRPRIRELPSQDMERLASAHDEAPEDIADLLLERSAEADWQLSITPPDRPDGLTAPLRFTVSAAQVEGERLGSLAERLGLREVVHRARRPGAGPRIGTLSLLPAGERR
jgi:hypothetical protein